MSFYAAIYSGTRRGWWISSGYMVDSPEEAIQLRHRIQRDSILSHQGGIISWDSEFVILLTNKECWLDSSCVSIKRRCIAQVAPLGLWLTLTTVGFVFIKEEFVKFMRITKREREHLFGESLEMLIAEFNYFLIIVCDDGRSQLGLTIFIINRLPKLIIIPASDAALPFCVLC